jgi:hypothetical protein
MHTHTHTYVLTHDDAHIHTNIRTHKQTHILTHEHTQIHTYTHTTTTTTKPIHTNAHLPVEFEAARDELHAVGEGGGIAKISWLDHTRHIVSAARWAGADDDLPKVGIKELTPNVEDLKGS